MNTSKVNKDFFMKKLIVGIVLVSLYSLVYAKEIDISKSKGLDQEVIIELYPKPTARDVEKSLTIKAEFAIEIDEKSIQKNNIKLKNLDKKKKKPIIKGDIILTDSKSLSFTPHKALESGFYEVEIKSLKAIKSEKKKKIKEIKYRFEVPETHLTIDDVLSDINSSKSIEPKVLVDTLKAYYAQFDADVNVAITLKLTPIFILLNENYITYKSIILDMYTDKNNHKLLRLPMLEFISDHMDDKESLDALIKVFNDKKDDSLILGKTAKTLIKSGIDISKEVSKRYPTSNSTLKTYYAKILAYFNPKEAREMIEKDMDSEIEGNRKIKLISAFAKTGIDDDYVIDKLMDLLYITIPNSHYHPVEKEIISVAITINLGRSTRDDRFMKLIDIASNGIFSEITRSTALDKLYFDLPTNTTVDKSAIKVRLQQLSQDILSSTLLREDQKSYLNKSILKILDSLKGV